MFSPVDPPTARSPYFPLLMRTLRVLTPLVALVCLVACDRKTNASAEPRSARVAPTLAHYELAEKSPEVIRLDRRLREISGLAMSGEGRLFAVTDEKGAIYELEPTTGAIVKRFDLGDPVAKGDFEGLAVDGTTLYAITSDGSIYIFSEGEDGASVPFEIVATGLTRYDIEALCVDASTRSLLIGCKEMPDAAHRGGRAVFAWSIASRTLEDGPRFIIDEEEIASIGGGRTFRPSSIERAPDGRSFVVVASQGQGIVEIDSSGALLGFVALPRRAHEQPEGVTFAPDGSLIISNEGAGGGTLVRYPARRPS